MATNTSLTVVLNSSNQPVRCVHNGTYPVVDPKTDNSLVAPGDQCHFRPKPRPFVVAPIGEDNLERLTIQWNKKQFLVCQTTPNITKTSTLVSTDFTVTGDGIVTITLLFTKLRDDQLFPVGNDKPPIYLEDFGMSIQIEFWPDMA